MEVCVDSVTSAMNAQKGGAIRLELCSSLQEGGTTPSIGLLEVVKECVRIPVFTIIRPRGGDFLYDELEIEIMKRDIVALKHARADGIVLGILNVDGTVNMPNCKELIDLAKPLPVTFHRAIDMTSHIDRALESIIHLKCDRVLTSGGASSALEGLPVIQDLVKQARGRISVMPAGGINSNNLKRILEGSKAEEFHCSARSSVASGMNFQKSGISMGASLSPSEFSVKTADVSIVQKLNSIADELWNSMHT